MSSHQEVIISVRVNVTPALYACQLSYDSSVMVLRKVVILWFAKAFFLNRCHGEGQTSLQRWRGILLLNMSVGELVDWHVGRYVCKSVSPKTAIYNWRTRLKAGPLRLKQLTNTLKIRILSETSILYLIRYASIILTVGLRL